MAELTTLARPYAYAAFEYAKEANCLDSWATALGTLAAIVSQDKVIELLGAPALTSEAQAVALIEICGDSLDEKMQNFIKTLSENKRLALLAEINALFAQEKAKAEKTIDVEVSSAFTVDESALAGLSASLEKALAQKVKVQSVVDESLIGGVVVRAGDTVIDGSVRGKLAKLAERLAS